MIHIFILLLAGLAVYTNAMIFNVLLYIIIGAFALIWGSTYYLITREELYKILDNIIKIPAEISHNSVILQIMIIFLPLSFGGWWTLSALWVVSSSIQHMLIYNFIQTRNNNYGRKS